MFWVLNGWDVGSGAFLLRRHCSRNSFISTEDIQNGQANSGDLAGMMRPEYRKLLDQRRSH